MLMINYEDGMNLENKVSQNIMLQFGQMKKFGIFGNRIRNMRIDDSMGLYTMMNFNEFNNEPKN